MQLYREIDAQWQSIPAEPEIGFGRAPSAALRRRTRRQ